MPLSGYYDFVVSRGVFFIAAESEEATARLVRQAVRLLKPGTRLLFIGYSSDPSCAPSGCVGTGCACGDGRINLVKLWWAENADTLQGLKDVEVRSWRTVGLWDIRQW